MSRQSLCAVDLNELATGGEIARVGATAGFADALDRLRASSSQPLRGNLFLRWVRLEGLRSSPLLTDGTPAGWPRRWISPRLNHVVRFVSLLVLHQA